MSKKMRSYTKEFKVKICELVLRDGIKIAEVAKKFDLNDTMIYRWTYEYQEKGENAFTGTGHMSPVEEAYRKIQKENEKLKIENEILKKAAAYFAKDPSKR